MVEDFNMQFKTNPNCETCRHKPAKFFVFNGGGWKFVCDCRVDEDHYWFEIERFFRNPMSVIDWLAHLKDKEWFDANDFCSMIHRLRAATESYWQC